MKKRTQSSPDLSGSATVGVAPGVQVGVTVRVPGGVTAGIPAGGRADSPSGATGLTWALLDAARAVLAEVEARAAGTRMTVVQAGLARHLAETVSGTPMTELAARAGMTAPATTQIMRRMSDSGLVHRSESPYDSRVVLVRLTDIGRREHDAIAARVAVIDRQLGRRAGWNPEDLARTLARMASSGGG